MYGLKQAPRAWYARLDKHLKEQGFRRGVIDRNIYIKMEDKDMIIIGVYVDDIIFGSSSDKLSKRLLKK